MITILNGPYRILCHAPDEVRTTLLILFSSNLLQPFARNTRSGKLAVNDREVNSDQSVIIKQIEHLIKKPVRLMTDKTEETVKVFEM
ncbi:hypothetical protein K503DRAFT_778086 [Rhizopogon vinicolor AM-OR11-026]|uniref:Uncharacterized protein n=1 Tax=Rhizopogon vinicolor AM-OR11-026 TaxID=1314800 RepID=A0A1B7MDI3_9AGAM|nr:hypothetical protein K503DRAFT_778086 [Rhizopogon vinicolor AM-OR11-026]